MERDRPRQGGRDGTLEADKPLKTLLEEGHDGLSLHWCSVSRLGQNGNMVPNAEIGVSGRRQ